MYEDYYLPLTQQQIARYFERVGLKYDPEEKPTRDLLDRVIRAQLRHIPFDDADVWAKGAWPSLAIADLFDKIITKKRGGYCFELNSLFCRLLKDLGFEAYLVIIHLGGRPVLGPPAHCGCVVIIDGVKHFADVGYGGPVPDGAVKFGGELDNGHKQYMDRFYTIVASENEDGTFLPRFRFKDMPCDPVELVPLNYHTSQRPDSGFRHRLMMNLRLDDGFAEIHDRLLKVKRGDALTQRELTDQEDVRQTVEKYFGIPAASFPTKDFEDTAD